MQSFPKEVRASRRDQPARIHPGTWTVPPHIWGPPGPSERTPTLGQPRSSHPVPVGDAGTSEGYHGHGHTGVLAGRSQHIAPIARPQITPMALLHIPLPPQPPPPPPPARAGPARSRWLCLAARCRSRRASRPACAGPNRMTRFGAPRLLPAPRRREQIRSDGSICGPAWRRQGARGGGLQNPAPCAAPVPRAHFR